ncbi:myb family transcription factor RLI1-like [Tasmannia lanceolata]|uniref:myb family transcription factor RLI1-like n=1 Tax=Tasmannia lanceolata TaxID=3420 RepID=UPI0040635A7E
MNTHKIASHEDKHRSLSGCSLYSGSSYQNLSSRQLCKMGVSFQFPLSEGVVHHNIPRRPISQSSDSPACLEGGSPPPSFMPSNSSCTDSNCFELESPPFYVNDCNSVFPPYVYQIGTRPLFSQLSPICYAEFSSPGPSEGQLSVDLPKQNDLNLQPCDTLQSVVKLPMYDNQNSRTSDHCNKFQHRNSQDNELLPFIRSNPGEDETLDGSNFYSVEGFHNPSVGCNPFNATVTQPSFQIPSDNKQFLKFSGGVHVNSSTVQPAIAASSKTRIRWTQDLHERFVESVNRLGGADKATPKGILKLMDTDGLTIFHVKSHLQKYRFAKCIPDSAEGKFERKASTNDIPQFDLKTGIQITEALRIQVDVQIRLHEQLEIQRKLQVQIEEQGKQLQKMFDQQQKAKSNLFETQNLDILFSEEQPVSLPDVQVQGAGEGFENTHFPTKIT